MQDSASNYDYGGPDDDASYEVEMRSQEGQDERGAANLDQVAVDPSQLVDCVGARHVAGQDHVQEHVSMAPIEGAAEPSQQEADNDSEASVSIPKGQAPVPVEHGAGLAEQSEQQRPVEEEQIAGRNAVEEGQTAGGNAVEVGQGMQEKRGRLQEGMQLKRRRQQANAVEDGRVARGKESSKKRSSTESPPLSSERLREIAWKDKKSVNQRFLVQKVRKLKDICFVKATRDHSNDAYYEYWVLDEWNERSRREVHMPANSTNEDFWRTFLEQETKWNETRFLSRQMEH